MQKQFTFVKQIKKKNGAIKTRTYNIKGDIDGTVDFMTVNVVRTCMDKKHLAENEGKDGLDVSGAGVGNTHQIIWKDGRFICVPYNEEYVRTRGSKSSKKNSQKTENAIPVYVLADQYNVPTKAAITCCERALGRTSLTEYDSLTKKELDKVSERLYELSELYNNNQVDENEVKRHKAKQTFGVRMSGSTGNS